MKITRTVTFYRYHIGNFHADENGNPKMEAAGFIVSPVKLSESKLRKRIQKEHGDFALCYKTDKEDVKYEMSLDDFIQYGTRVDVEPIAY